MNYALQIGRLSQIGRFLLERKASSEEHWVYTHVSTTWCSFAYRSSGAGFVSSGATFVMAEQHSNGNGFCKRASFY